jgi:predicted DsbA family dithiol-disulfide isomerase
VSGVRLIVYSDFLCPWCWNAATKLASVQQSLGPALTVEWKSYLLRPRPEPGRDLEKFRAYTQGWLRVAADEPRAPFVPWASDAGPPSHSVPAHAVAKAAAALSEEAGARLRDRLFRAYFAESRDISDRSTLAALWNEVGLAPDAFATSDDPGFVRQVFADHEEAQSLGATGVPAVRLADQDFVLVGAQPEAVYQRWLSRALAAAASAGAASARSEPQASGVHKS